MENNRGESWGWCADAVAVREALVEKCTHVETIPLNVSFQFNTCSIPPALLGSLNCLHCCNSEYFEDLQITVLIR